MNTYKIVLNVEKEINAEDENEALDMFWDYFHSDLSDNENHGITMATLCGNCGREATKSAGETNRCERCTNL